MIIYTRFARADRKQKAAVAQSVERRIGSAEVTGPIPVSSFANEMPETFTEECLRHFCIWIICKI